MESIGRSIQPITCLSRDVGKMSRSQEKDFIRVYQVSKFVECYRKEAKRSTSGR